MTTALFLFFFFLSFFRVIKLAVGMFTYVAHFDRKVEIYIATKLFQFAAPKEPYAILAGPDGFFRPCSRHRVRPSYGDFLSSFAMKACAGPYGSYDNRYYLFRNERTRSPHGTNNGSPCLYILIGKYLRFYKDLIHKESENNTHRVMKHHGCKKW